MAINASVLLILISSGEGHSFLWLQFLCTFPENKPTIVQPQALRAQFRPFLHEDQETGAVAQPEIVPD